MTGRRRIWPIIRRIWITTGISLTVVFIAWSLVAYRASSTARSAIKGDAVVEVRNGDGYRSFIPRAGTRPGLPGLVFYAGALVDPVAYAPLALAIAREGHVVLLVELPRRGAFGGADGDEVMQRAREAMRLTPAVNKWFVAGHSRGGAVAARFMLGNTSGVAGLILVGTSHPRDFSLAGVTVPVVKILGTNDGVAQVEKSERNRHLLPATTRWVLIEGGNHSQFGWYGFQPGDRFALITRKEQHERTVRAILDALSTTVPMTE
jgi:predicted alpha/beta-hydrolase family hydrolase